MSISNRIRLFWWSEPRLHNKSKENYGDLLGKYLVEKITNKKVIWSKPNTFSFLDFFKPIYVTIGSILAHVNDKCIVWGSGIISKDIAIKKAKFLAVRGPQTRQHLMQCGYDVPEIYGDPALLLPLYYKPNVKKEYKLGVIPHYSDYKDVKDWVKDKEEVLLIDLMTNDIEETTRQFLKCKQIVSSSLHGIIVSHAYGIPAVWQPFSDKLFGDNVKFQDYFESVEIQPYQPEIINSILNEDDLMKLFKNKEILPSQNKIEALQNGLLEACPFKNE